MPEFCVELHTTEYCGDHSRDVAMAIDISDRRGTVQDLAMTVLGKRAATDYLTIRRVVTPEEARDAR